MQSRQSSMWERFQAFYALNWGTRIAVIVIFLGVTGFVVWAAVQGIILRSWLLLIQTAPLVPQLWAAKGPILLLPLIALIAQALMWPALGLTLLWSGLAMVTYRGGKKRKKNSTSNPISWQPSISKEAENALPVNEQATSVDLRLQDGRVVTAPMQVPRSKRGGNLQQSQLQPTSPMMLNSEPVPAVRINSEPLPILSGRAEALPASQQQNMPYWSFSTGARPARQDINADMTVAATVPSATRGKGPVQPEAQDVPIRVGPLSQAGIGMGLKQPEQLPHGCFLAVQCTGAYTSKGMSMNLFLVADELLANGQDPRRLVVQSKLETIITRLQTGESLLLSADGHWELVKNEAIEG